MSVILSADDVRRAINRVSGYAEDLGDDRPTADRLAAAARLLPRADLYRVLAAAGLEGVKARDTRVYLLTRLHNRLTARVRARERAEV